MLTKKNPYLSEIHLKSKLIPVCFQHEATQKPLYQKKQEKNQIWTCISHVPEILCFSSKLIYCVIVDLFKQKVSARQDEERDQSKCPIQCSVFSALVQSSLQWASVSRSWLKLKAVNLLCEPKVPFIMLPSGAEKAYL